MRPDFSGNGTERRAGFVELNGPLELGAVERQLSLPRLSSAILDLCAAGAHASKPVA